MDIADLSDNLTALNPVLETALDAVVVIRSDGVVAAWNAAAERTFGWSSEEALGLPMAELIVPAQHRKAHSEGLKRYLETGEKHVLNRRIEITALKRDGEEIPIELSITKAPFAGDPLFIGFMRDISQRRRAEEKIDRLARETRLLFEFTKLAAETESFDDALRACLKAICDLTGWPVGHALTVARNRNELISTRIWHEAVAGSSAALQSATYEQRFTEGVGLPGIILQTGKPLWMADVDIEPKFARKGLGYSAAFGFPVKSEGKTIAVLEFFAPESMEPDSGLMRTVRTLGEQMGRVIERRRTEEHQRLLLNELNHRVKNTLAIVQSIAAQTFKGQVDAARRAFDSRLMALAAAHDILTTENWESASLHDVVLKTGLGCGADEERVSIAGPELRLEPQTAVAFAMALHELCTNAVKYGALSNSSGRIDISWAVTDDGADRRLRLIWREIGGPAVVAPRKRGFGSVMIERALASELGGTAKLEFEPAGLVCEVEAPLPSITSV